MPKNIILCADDYGLNRPTSQGILRLIAEQRLSAASCMVNFADWFELAEPLAAYTNQIDIGLHFNLTEGQTLAAVPSLLNHDHKFFDINQLVLRCFLKKISKRDVVGELNRQIDQFEAAFKMLPDYVDGHQHVHHLPIIRDAILEVYQQRLRSHGAYIRSVKLSCATMVKNVNSKLLVIQLTGAYRFWQRLKEANIPHNQSFAGFYDFNPRAIYRDLFAHFLTSVGDRGIIMCHPGFLDKHDSIGEARQNELNYFISEAFLQDCQRHQVKIGRFNKGISNNEKN